jgi:hypothetical protein
MRMLRGPARRYTFTSALQRGEQRCSAFGSQFGADGWR